MEQKIIELQHEIKLLHEKIDNLTHLLQQEVAPNSQKMSNHIDFINHVYDGMRTPLDWFCQKINHLSGNNTICGNNSNNGNNDNNSDNNNMLLEH